MNVQRHATQCYTLYDQKAVKRKYISINMLPNGSTPAMGITNIGLQYLDGGGGEG
jgi:hypothetical protein